MCPHFRRRQPPCDCLSKSNCLSNGGPLINSFTSTNQLGYVLAGVLLIAFHASALTAVPTSQQASPSETTDLQMGDAHSGATAKIYQPPTMSLHEAVIRDDLSIVERHIQAGTDIDLIDQYGSTPLLVAVTFGRTPIAKVLLDAGANPNIIDAQGSPVLHTATLLARGEIVRLLLDHGASLHARSISGALAFDIAVSPIDDDLNIYAALEKGLSPIGYSLDLDLISDTRALLAPILRPALHGDTAEPVDDMEERSPYRVDLPRIDPVLSSRLIDELYKDALHLPTLYSLLLYEKGHLVAEQYFNKGSLHHKNRLASVTKSYMSALVGLALEQGCISGLEEPAVKFFPEIEKDLADPRKSEVTLKHLLQMRAGYPWEESRPEYWDGMLSGHQIPLMKTYPLIAKPGAQFNYSNLSSHWLATTVARACQVNLRTYLQEKLLTPLNSTLGEWAQDRDGNYLGMGGMHLTSREMGNFGVMYQNFGQFAGKRVLPEEWVRGTLKNYSPDAWLVNPDTHRVGRYFRNLNYGYQWWFAKVGDLSVHYAMGHGGQLIVLVNELDLVIVTTAYPFFLEHNARAWKQEQAIVNLIGKFIWLLQQE